MDKDNHLDLIVGNDGANDKVYLGDGTGSFTYKGAVQGDHSNSTSALAYHDINGDGNGDLIAGNSGEGYLYFGKGDGTFQAGKQIGDLSFTYSIAVEDVDGDGFADVVAGGAASINIFYNNRNNSDPFNNVKAKKIPDIYDNVFVFGDVDGDSNKDLIVGTGAVSYNKLYLNNGQGGFGEGIQIGSEEEDRNTTRSVFLDDINGDGWRDLISANDGNNRLYLYDSLNRKFGDGINITENTNDTKKIISVDMNSNGQKDVISLDKEYLISDTKKININYKSKTLGLRVPAPIWKPLTDEYPSLAIGALSFDSDDPNIIYVGTGSKSSSNKGGPSVGVLKSVDGGKTFKIIGENEFNDLKVRDILVNNFDAQSVTAQYDGAHKRITVYYKKGTSTAKQLVDAINRLTNGPVSAELFQGTNTGEGKIIKAQTFNNVTTGAIFLEKESAGAIFPMGGNNAIYFVAKNQFTSSNGLKVVFEAGGNAGHETVTYDSIYRILGLIEISNNKSQITNKYQ